MKATIMYVDGTIAETTPKNGTDFSLEELNSIVDGHIEFLFSLDGKQIMVLNEEGKLHDLPYNSVATQVAKTYFGLFGDHIVGNALVCDIELIK